MKASTVFSSSPCLQQRICFIPVPLAPAIPLTSKDHRDYPEGPERIMCRCVPETNIKSSSASKIPHRMGNVESISSVNTAAATGKLAIYIISRARPENVQFLQSQLSGLSLTWIVDLEETKSYRKAGAGRILEGGASFKVET